MCLKTADDIYNKYYIAKIEFEKNKRTLDGFIATRNEAELNRLRKHSLRRNMKELFEAICDRMTHLEYEHDSGPKEEIDEKS